MANAAPLLVLGLGWSIALLMITIYLPAADTQMQNTGSRLRRFLSSWGLVLGVGVGLVALGLVLWWPRRGLDSDANSDLGAALLGAAVVPFAIFMLERRFDRIARQRDRDEAARVDALRKVTNERNHAQIMTALLRELPGIDLRGRDLGGFYLRGKVMPDAFLEDAQLDGARLSYAVLTGAFMARCRLDGALIDAADLSDADLSNAWLDHTDLSGADLRGAVFDGADLATVDLRGADLRATQLRDCSTFTDCDLRDARYDPARTTFPGSVDVRASGAVAVSATDPWSSEAALKAGNV